MNSYINEYIEFLRTFIKTENALISVFDASNGTTGLIVEPLFSKIPFVSGYFLNTALDGSFPAHGPDPLREGALNELSRAVLSNKADLGIIFDADGDRVFFIDNMGTMIDQDSVAYVLMKQHKPPYVIDSGTGWTIREPFKNQYIESNTGHIFIKQAMRVHDASFGAERSGHYYFKDFFFAESGIRAAIEMINVVSGLRGEGKTIHEYVKSFSHYTRGKEMNVAIGVHNSGHILNEFLESFKNEAQEVVITDGVTMRFEDWWFNIRQSNTESLMRINTEGRDKPCLEKGKKRIEEIVVRLGLGKMLS